MRQLLFCLLAVLGFACRTKQWNLNSTIGWNKDKDFSLLLLKWRDKTFEKDSFYIRQKQDIENKVLAVLQASKLGEEAERDSADLATMHFLIVGNQKKAKRIIVETLTTEGQAENLVVVEREYVAHDKWVDKVIYPSKK